jgi:hypothetical protein
VQPTFYHTWFLTPQGADCMVVMDEAGIGKDAAHVRETDESLMHRGHDLWLATLKWVAESQQFDGGGDFLCRPNHRQQ